jgi:2,3-bisphosphoglycerate-independent phosphoglycerate mutase
MTKHRPHILLIFIDGVGVGRRDARSNPFASARLHGFKTAGGGMIPFTRNAHHATDSSSVTSLNATLGIAGLPQSGTGQSALVTGLNTPKLIGKHFGPYLFSSLKPVVSRDNIFRRLREIGRRPYYANAYPHQYFEYLTAHRRVTVLPFAWMESGYALNDYKILDTGRALSADITNERWHRLGYPALPVITPNDAGKRLGALAGEYDFILFEFFDTDHAGHRQQMHEAIHTLEKVDEMIAGVLDSINPERTLLLVTSDHGNIEDLSTKSHTRNPVPLFAFGTHHHTMTNNVKMLTDVTPAIIELMK